MTELPFSEPVNVRRLPKKGERLQLSLTDDVKKHLLSEYDLLGVDQFHCEAIVSPWKKNGVRVEGRVTAQLTQPCAVTGEPLQTKLDEFIEALFVPEGSKLALPRLDERGEIVLDAEGDDLPETFSGDSIDLAEIWMEFFALGYDPYARMDGVELDPDLVGDGEIGEKASPFAVLEALKKH